VNLRKRNNWKFEKKLYIFFNSSVYILCNIRVYIYIYICVCVCVCVCATYCVSSSEPVYAFSMETVLSYFRKDCFIYIRILLPSFYHSYVPLPSLPVSDIAYSAGSETLT